MSTRSQIRFVQEIDHETDGGETKSTRRIAQIYRHSDGYPENVLPALDQLKTLQNQTRTERNPSYVAANFIFLNKLQGIGLSLDRPGEYGTPLRPQDVMAAIREHDIAGIAALDQPYFLLGYGVENPESGIHGDEEYLYVVELPSRNRLEVPGEWTVRVSSHKGFPRWDGPTEEAFERATWQYEGSLTGAMGELVAEPV